MDENQNQTPATTNRVDFNSEGVLDSILNFYMNIVRNGLTAVIPYAEYLVAVLGIIDLATSWWLYDGEMKFNVLIQKVLKISFLFCIVMNWHGFMTTLGNSFAFIGYVAGGHSATEALATIQGHDQSNQFLSPSKIIDLSDTVVQPLYNAVSSSSYSIGSIFLLAICWLMIKVGFIFIAVQVLLTQIEFSVFTILSVVLLPFNAFKHTEFLSKRCISGVFSFGIKLMVVMFLCGLIGSLSDSMNSVITETGKDGKIEAAPKIMKAALAYFTVGYLTWKLPNLISSMMSGEPSMGNDMTPGKMIGGVAGAAVGAYRGAGKMAKGYGKARAMWQATGAGAAMAAATAGLADAAGGGSSNNNFPKQNSDKKDSGDGKDSGKGGESEGAEVQAASTSSGSNILPGINYSSSSEEASTPVEKGGEQFKGVAQTAKDNAKSFAKGAASFAGDAAKGAGKAAYEGFLAQAVSSGIMSQGEANADREKMAGRMQKVGNKANQVKADVQSSYSGMKQGVQAARSVASDFASSTSSAVKGAVASKVNAAYGAVTTANQREQLSRLGNFTKGVAGHTKRFAALAGKMALANNHIAQSYMEGARSATVSIGDINRLNYTRQTHNYVQSTGTASRGRLGNQINELSHNE